MKKDESLKHFVVAHEFCGTCAGTCAGCLLTLEERRSEREMQSPEALTKGLSILKDLRERDGRGNEEVLVLVLGRGNNLALNETSWMNGIAAINKTRSIIPHSDLIIEVSTSLIGKLDHQLSKAKELLLMMRENISKDVDINFVIVANGDLISPPYWSNLDSFIKEMAQWRLSNGINGEETVSMNIRADNLPDCDWLFSKFKDSNITHNLILSPFGLNFGKKGSEEDFKKLNGWIKKWASLMMVHGIRSGLVSFLKLGLDMSSAEAMDTLNNHQGTAWFITEEGEVLPGLPSGLGDLEFKRFLDKLEINGEDSTSVVNTAFGKEAGFPARKCISCNVRTMCITAGGLVTAMINVKNGHPGEQCPSGLYEAANYIKDNF